ncbi:MAG: hypothetical protein ABSH32_36060 [Bryobacteraceae bacterium]
MPDGCASFDSNSNFAPCQVAAEPMVFSPIVTVTDGGGNMGTYSWTIDVYWNPTQAQFISTQNQYFAQMLGQVGSNLQQPLATGGNLIIANPKFRSSNYDTYPQWALWIRAMKASNMSVVWIYPDVECFVNNRSTCISLYSNAIGYAHSLKMSVRLSPGFYNTATCGDAGCPARGIGPAIFTCGGSCGSNDLTPGGSYTGAPNVYCVQISTPSSTFTFGANSTGTDCSTGGTKPVSTSATLLVNGLTVKFGSTTGHNTGDKWTMTAAQNGLVSACPVPSHSGGGGAGFNQGTAGGYQSGVADWYYCLTTSIAGLGNSVTGALLGLLISGDWFVPIHEPTTQAETWGEGIQPSACATGTQSAPSPPILCNGNTGGTPPGPLGNTCPQDWVTNFWTPFSTNITIPAGVTVGATLDYSPEMDTPQQTSGINQTYAAYFSSNFPHHVYMGMDLYNWTPSYTAVTSCPGACSPTNGTYPYTINQFKTTSSDNGGHDGVFVQEFGPMNWVITNSIMGQSAPNTQSCAIIGLQSCSWSALDQNFYAGMLTYLASYGTESAGQFGSDTLAACAAVFPDNGLNFTVIATATGAMANQQYSSDSQRLASIVAAWARSAISGGTVSGSTIH